MINSILSFFTGITLFFFGIKTINRILGNINKNHIRKIINGHNNSFIGIIKGIIVTATVQSSSFITVLLTSLVDNKILTLYESSSIIMGSNIGTCITGFFIAGILANSFTFDVTLIMGLISIISFIYYIKKSENKANFLIGLIIILLSMNIMSNSSIFITNFSNFNSILKYLENPLFGLLIGIILTAIFQSSSLVTGIICSVSLTSNMTYLTAINLVLGSNIGTCSTAILSGIKLSSNAKKVGYFHLIFNIIGTIIFLIGLYLITYIFKVDLINYEVKAYDIAIINILFNIISTIVLLPFNKKIINLCHKLVK